MAFNTSSTRSSERDQALLEESSKDLRWVKENTQSILSIEHSELWIICGCLFSECMVLWDQLDPDSSVKETAHWTTPDYTYTFGALVWYSPDADSKNLETNILSILKMELNSGSIDITWCSLHHSSTTDSLRITSKSTTFSSAKWWKSTSSQERNFWLKEINALLKNKEPNMQLIQLTYMKLSRPILQSSRD